MENLKERFDACQLALACLEKVASRPLRTAHISPEARDQALALFAASATQNGAGVADVFEALRRGHHAAK